MKKIYFFLTLFLIPLLGFAQDISFKAAAPKTVVVGQQFRLEYIVNSDGTKDLRIPELTDFDVLAGPYESVSRSEMFVNGQRSSSITIKYTYTLLAKNEGTFTIPAGSIKVKNSEYKSNSLQVKVLPADQAGGGQHGASNQPAQRPSGNDGSQVIGSDEMFVRMHVSKSSAYENEGISVSFKLYSLYDQVSFKEIKFPDFEGFIVQDVELPDDRQWSLESYNGRNYRTVLLKQSVLFPQRSGEIKIGPGKFDCIVQVRARNEVRSIFDNPFFYTNVVKPLATSGATISVKALPSGKPASFTGAVGDYKMTSSISTENLKSNESVTVKVAITGSGNIKLISNPEIVFPNDFEIYDPKVDLNLKISGGGVTGGKTIEYLAIPRYAGDFTIPSAEFSFFDPKSGTYKTLRTEEYKLHVEKGEEGAGGAVFSNASNKEDLKFLGKDIRYIKTGDFSFNKKKDYFFGSVFYIVLYILPLILFIVFFIIYRKQVKENANIALVRTKKANKVASKRLKTAGVLLRENKREEFYDEVLKALWGYLSDKLNIPVASLTKDNVETELMKYGVDESLIKEFMDILNTCEFARFAPVQDEHEMDKVYESTVQAIDKMENTIKK